MDVNAADARNAILVVRGLRVEYGPQATAVCALRDVDLAMEAGERRGLVGESGSGKTTLGRAIPGLVGYSGRVVHGSVVVGGLECNSLTGRGWAQVRRRHLSEVFQDPLNSLDPVRTIYSQVAEAIRLRDPDRRRWRGRRMRDAVSQALSGAELPSAERVMRQFPHELSGGMRQRVAIAMAMVGDTQLLIADEPTTALDVVTQRAVLASLERAVRRRHTAVLFITHNLALASEFCETLSVMYAGRIVEEGPAHLVMRGPRHPYTVGLMGAIPQLVGRKRMEPIPGDPPALSERELGCAFAPRCPIGRGREKCETELPGVQPVGPGREGHWVRCHFPSEVTSLVGGAD